MKKIAYVHERGEYKNMKNKKEKKQEEEELTGMAAVWDYLKTFLIIFCVVFAMNKLVYINAVIPSESMQAEYDYERRPGAGKPSGIYQR